MGIRPVYQIKDLFLHYWFFFIKMVEKTMYSRLNQHLSINNIPATGWHGFRKERSTEHAAYTLTNGILKAWNSKLQVFRIFLWPREGFRLCKSWYINRLFCIFAENFTIGSILYVLRDCTVVTPRWPPAQQNSDTYISERKVGVTIMQCSQFFFFYLILLQTETSSYMH